MLRDQSAIRGRVERLATSILTACSGQHVFSHISVCREGEPEPVWPESGAPSRCQCGAELRYHHTVIELCGLSDRKEQGQCVT